MSVATPDAFFGHATQRPPEGVIADLAFSNRFSKSARVLTNNTATSADALPALAANRTPLGKPSSVVSNPAGAPTRSTAFPSFIPSFFASGVPEYPAMQF